MSLSVEQCRTARELLGWNQETLAHNSSVSKFTVSLFERKKTTPQASTLKVISDAFAAAGIKFIDNDREFGVVLLKKKEEVDK